MKRFLLVFLLFFSSASFSSDTVTFQLKEVLLSDLIRVVFQDILNASVITSSEIIDDKKPLDFAIKDIEKIKIPQHIEVILKSRGYNIRKIDGIYHIGRVIDPDTVVFVYRPKYRSVSYLNDFIGSLLNRNNIITNRLVSNNENQNVSGVNAVSDNGNSALSLIDKGDKDIIVVKAKPSEIEQIKSILLEIDSPIPEMLIKSVLLEVQTGDNKTSAINILAKLLSSGVAGVSFSWGGGADSSNGFKLKLGGLEAVYSAIESDSRFKVLSSPQIRVKSGASAKFSVGAETPVLGAVSYPQNGNPVQSVEYKSSGVILELRPEIRGELAELKIFQQLSNFAKTETGVNNSPTLLKRELQTSVVVGQSDVVLLGGLEEEKTLTNESGFFFMPSSLRSHSSESSKSQIVLMLYVERVRTPGEPSI